MSTIVITGGLIVDAIIVLALIICRLKSAVTYIFQGVSAASKDLHNATS